VGGVSQPRVLVGHVVAGGVADAVVAFEHADSGVARRTWARGLDANCRHGARVHQVDFSAGRQLLVTSTQSRCLKHTCWIRFR
jgi:hypothetical protein